MSQILFLNTSLNVCRCIRCHRLGRFLLLKILFEKLKVSREETVKKPYHLPQQPTMPIASLSTTAPPTTRAIQMAVRLVSTDGLAPTVIRLFLILQQTAPFMTVSTYRPLIELKFAYFYQIKSMKKVRRHNNIAYNF